MLKLYFWISLALIVYTYFGYTLIIWFFSLFRKVRKLTQVSDSELPEVTHIIAAYNEQAIIPQKIKNCNSLNYPANKITHLWVTDGSNDSSNTLLKNTPGIKLLHKPERKGKTAALNRAMQHVKTSYTVFSDANAMLSENAIRELVCKFDDPMTGCVAGEKKISTGSKEKAPGAGEGIYWNYESLIKKLESNFGSTMGAVGELYAIRTNLYSNPPENTILDDFVVSLGIAHRGFQIKYNAQACAEEFASKSIQEELKRKIRIAAGGFQALTKYPGLLNFFKHPKLSFQYLSHKVMRWLFVPLSLLGVLISNYYIVRLETTPLFEVFLMLQGIFYLFAFGGFLLRNTALKLKLFFLPYYILMMNYAQLAGLFRFIRGKQSAAWEKAVRK